MSNHSWVVVFTTYGAFDADVIVGRLRTEGIPARFWTESAGRALGITVGKLGTSYIEVPESFFDQAKSIIQTDYSEEIDLTQFEDDEFEDLDPA